MTAPEVERLLRAWEAGASRSGPVRALLMASAAEPGDSPDALAALSIGRRNAHLLTLRERLLGPTVEGLTGCPSCGERTQLSFAVSDVLTDFAESDATHHASALGYDVHFRMPTAADLIALERETDAVVAEQRLFERCVLDASSDTGPATADELPADVVTAVVERMSALDPQAAVVLDIVCPECGAGSQPPFDVAAFVWTEIDVWARTLLREVHAIASAYGWSESSILALTPARRRGYLELIGA